jgi:hypothetical protein
MKSMAEALLAAGILLPACSRKHTYVTRRSAEACANQCTARRRWKLYVYRCERCSALEGADVYHLTKRPQFKGGK